MRLQRQTLIPYTRPERMLRYLDVLKYRRDNIRVVFENVADPGNIDAVLRTAESLGLQHFHQIESLSPFQPSSYEYARWLTVHRHPDAASCAAELKAAGFTIVATTLSPKAVDLRCVDLSNRRIALLCGNEHNGVSRTAAAMADVHVTLPMRGFAQSLNVSVAAATVLARLTAATPHEPLAPPPEGDAARLPLVSISDGRRVYPVWRQPSPVAPAPPETGPVVVTDAPLPAPVLYPCALAQEEREAALASWITQGHWAAMRQLRAAGIELEGM